MMSWISALIVAAAQQPPPPPATLTPRAEAEPWQPPPQLSPEEIGPDPERDLLELRLGKSLVLTLPEAPLSVSVTRSDVATATELGTPEVLLLQGRQLGTTDMVVIFPGGRLQMWDIEVARDLRPLERALERAPQR